MALIPDALQGRVKIVFRLLALGLIPLGAALSGVLIQLLGVRDAILLVAARRLMLAVTATLNREIRQAPPLPEP